MKKFIKIILVLIIGLSIGGCGNNNEDFSYLYGTWESNDTYTVNGNIKVKYELVFDEDGSVKYMNNETGDGKGSTGFELKDNVITFSDLEFKLDSSSVPMTITQLGDTQVTFTKVQ